MAVEDTKQEEVGVEKLCLGLSILDGIASTQKVDVIVLDGRLGLDVDGGLVGAQDTRRLGRTQDEWGRRGRRWRRARFATTARAASAARATRRRAQQKWPRPKRTHHSRVAASGQ